MKERFHDLIMDHGGKMFAVFVALVFAMIIWIVLRDEAQREADCVSICRSRGHVRFSVETSRSCYCSGPAGAYRPSELMPEKDQW